MTEISRGNSISISINTIRYKIIFVGDAGVGKTTIINRIHGNAFENAYDATIGVDFWPKNIKFRGSDITLQIWDTAGQERYRGLIPSYIRNSSIVFIVFDTTSKKSFESIPNWIDLIRNIAKNKLVLIGNKIDLKEKREVNKKEGDDLAKKENISYYEISAKDNDYSNLINTFYDSIIDLLVFSEKIENRKELIDELVKENREENLNINTKKTKKENPNDNNNVNNNLKLVYKNDSGFINLNSETMMNDISNIKNNEYIAPKKRSCFC